MKKILPTAIIFIFILSAIITPTTADPKNYDKRVSKGIYDFVTKEPINWTVLPRSSNAFGMGKFSIEDGILTMKINAHKLTPLAWYYVEIVSKDPSWTPINDDRFSRFYGQAKEDGTLIIKFSWNVSGYNDIEVNIKNADWVALLDPSDYGNEDGDWLYTGQGWDFVLYGGTLIQ